MKQSRRARRIQRHYSRMHRAGGLNLVSLMDIFTILVFFLMVNSSDVQVLQQSPDIDLPESKAEQQPEDVLTVTLTDRYVLVQGRRIAELAALPQDAKSIPPLQAELERLAKRKRGEVPEGGWPVMIVGDKTLHYKLLRAAMKSSVDAGFRQVKLAVNRAGEESDRG
ncbi:biopolymer transporter ExbD [Marinobacteraceae bacterium S3BR75-40.1]